MTMEFSTPLPFSEALDKLGVREIVPSAQGTAEWSGVEVAIRERAFLSARVESARVLQTMKDYLDDFMAGARMENGGLKAQGRAEFLADMRQLVIAEGLGRIDPATGKIDPVIREGDLTDIRSMRRLQLIFDTQVEAAQEFGFWKQGQNPDILYVFPAQQFIRVRPVMIPRDYHQAAEGSIRRKDDLEFWLSMNRDFNVPWGPWGFGSGMGVEDVDREEAIAAGVMLPEETVRPIHKDFNERLSASVRDLDGGIAAALKRISGGEVAGGRIVARETKFKETVLPDPEGKGTLVMDDAVFEFLRAATARNGHGEKFMERDLPPVMIPAIPEFLKVEADVLAGAQVEESVLINSLGEILTKTGGAKSVKWPDEYLKGALMSHTHTSGGTFSPEDIYAVALHEMVGIRAHAGRAIYSVVGQRRFPPFQSLQEMQKHPEHELSKREAWAVVNRLQDGYRWTSDQREEMATHLTWLGLERRGWISYHEEQIP
jgi:hypothetical protein